MCWQAFKNRALLKMFGPYKGGSNRRVEKMPIRSSLVSLLAIYCLGYQMGEDEMGSACGTQGFGWETLRKDTGRKMWV